MRRAGCRARRRPSRRRPASPVRSTDPTGRWPLLRSRRHGGRGSPPAHRLPRAGPRRTGGWSRTGCSACGSWCGRRRRATCARASRDARARRPRRHTRRRRECSPIRIRRRTPTWRGAARARRPSAGRTTTRPCDAACAGAPGPASIPCSRRKRSASRFRTSIALMAAMRAAASSMPRGRPSSVVQISVTAAAVSGSPSPKSRRTARARSTNSVTASDSVPPATASGETPSTASASTPSGSRDVARTLTLPARPMIISIAGRGGLQQVLAVVDDEQQPLAGERGGDRGDQRSVALRRDPEHGRNRGGDRPRIADRRQLDHPCSIGELPGKLGADLQRHSRLADPADAGQCDQLPVAHELGALAHQFVATDERGEPAVAGCLRSVRRCEAPGIPVRRPSAMTWYTEIRPPQPAEHVLAERP